MDKMRVAIYCRVGREDEYELSEQEKTLREYAVKNHYRNLWVYRDNGYSGLRLDDRPGLGQLNEDIKAGKIDVVIARDLARIGRSYSEMMLWMQGLNTQGIPFISMYDKCIP